MKQTAAQLIQLARTGSLVDEGTMAKRLQLPREVSRMVWLESLYVLFREARNGCLLVAAVGAPIHLFARRDALALPLGIAVAILLLEAILGVATGRGAFLGGRARRAAASVGRWSPYDWLRFVGSAAAVAGVLLLSWNFIRVLLDRIEPEVLSPRRLVADGLVFLGAGLLLLCEVRRRRVVLLDEDVTDAALDALPDLTDLASEVGDPKEDRSHERPGPTVPAPADLPDVVTPDNAEAAIQQVEREDPVMARVMRVIKEWSPKRHHYERDYQRRLYLRLLTEFSPNEVRQHQKLSYGPSGRGGKPDFTVAQRVLVEIKADLSRSTEAHRALGAFRAYVRYWRTRGPGLLVVCGDWDIDLKAFLDAELAEMKRAGLPIVPQLVSPRRSRAS